MNGMMLPRAMVNPGVEYGQQRILAQASSKPAQPAAGQPAAAPADAAAGTAAADPAAAPVEAPNTMKIVLGSALRGAFSGATMLFTASRFKFLQGPLSAVLGAIPFIKNMMPVAGSVIPGAAKVATAVLPPLKVLLIVGAGLGAVIGAVGGLREAKKQEAAFMEQQAKAAEAAQAAQAQTQQPVGDPLILGPDGKPIPIDPKTNMPVSVPAGSSAPAASSSSAPKNPVMGPDYKATSSSASKRGRKARRARAARAGFNYHIRRGDTLWALSRRFGVSIDAIVRANRGKISNPNLIYAGDTIVIPKKRRAAGASAARAKAASGCCGGSCSCCG